MKNLKSKISMLLSLSLLGAMLTAPCAQAQETTQWKTLYEQDFKAKGLTIDDLKEAGWTFSSDDNTTVDTQIGLRVGENGSYKNSATYGDSLGDKYKMTLVIYNTGNNAFVSFGESYSRSENVFYVTKKETYLNVTSTDKDTDTTENDALINKDLTVELIRDGKNISATVKYTDGTTKGRTLSVTSESLTYENGKLSFGNSESYDYGTYLKYAKIEVPQDYIEYKQETAYSNANLTTSEGYTADGWVYGGTGSTVSMGTNSGQTNRLIVTHGSGQSAYIFYNKDLGTAYNVKDKVCSYYNDVGVWFNATLGDDNRVMSGFYIDFGSQNKDNKWILKYAIRPNKEADLSWTTLATSSWTYEHGGTVEFDLEYMNGKITITRLNNNVLTDNILTYDASDLIVDHSELASGVIGQYNSNSRRSTSQMDFSYTTYVPAAEGCKLNTLIPVVSGENVNYSVKIDNNGSKVLSGAKVIAAAYDNQNRLIGIDTDAVYSGALGQVTVTGTFSVGENTPATYKAFLFDGLDTIKPLANCLTKTVAAE